MSDPNGEGAAEAAPEATEVSAGILGEGEAEFNPFGDLEDEYGEAGPSAHVMGADGVLQAVDQTSPSDIPALSPASLICMGDYSMFVARAGDCVVTFQPDEVERDGLGDWYTKKPAAVVGEVEGPLRVEPLRPPCKHYVRQHLPLTENRFHLRVARLCSARRTTEGTFMGVGDAGVFACDMRDPIDIGSLERMDAWDQAKIEQGKTRTFSPLGRGFGDQAEEPAGAGGIFGRG